MATFLGEVGDRDSTIQFLEWCVGEVGGGFHPDTPFAEYVNIGDGLRCFGDEEAARLDECVKREFDYCDPYEVGLGLLRQRLLPASGSLA